jgi:hypothetical protein
MRFITFALLSITALLSACGGGGVCGADSQIFEISLVKSSYQGKVGVPLEIQTILRPESCRGSMNIQNISGDLPPGMNISNGNVTGTPTRSGSYSFRLAIAGVDGYDTKGNFASSGTVFVSISP